MSLPRTTWMAWALLAGCTRYPAPGPEPATDPSPAWRELLESATSPRGVAYDKIADERDILDDYLSWIAVHGPNADDWNESKQDRRMAFMANAYNALVIEAVLDNQPLDSVQDVGGGLWQLHPGAKFFWGQKFRVNGEWQTLYVLEEQDLVNRYQDPLAHVTLNYAAKGSPPLRYWRERGLTGQMRGAMRRWLATDRGMRWDVDSDGYALNEVFSWYADDFTDWSDEDTVCGYLAQFASGDRKAWLEEQRDTCAPAWIPFDWSLNAAVVPEGARSDDPGARPEPANDEE